MNDPEGIAPVPEVPSEPIQHFFESQRLRLSYWDWGNEDAPPLVLVHGGRDHARTWDRVAEAFRAEYHVVALDLRGHGDSQWAVGSQYGPPDIALDVLRMIEIVGAPARVIAHSYGALSTLVGAGAYPELFSALVAIDGVDSVVIRGHDAGMGPRWMREWADKARAFETPRLRVYPTIEEAAMRLREENPRIPAGLLSSIAAYAVRPVEGGYVWKFDGWVLNRTSMEVRADEFSRFWAAVTCPVLLVSGTESHLRMPDNSDIPSRFPDSRFVMVEGAAHWVHHDHLPTLLHHVRAFFSEVAATAVPN